MNEEIRILRNALEQCQKRLNEHQQTFRYYLKDMNLIDIIENCDKPILNQVWVALNVIDGKLPEGHTVYLSNGGRWYVSHLVNGLRYNVKINGKEKYFYDETKARLFCWQHSQEQGDNL